MVVYICTKFHINILDSIKVKERTVFIRKNSKGHNSVKNVGGVSILSLCTSSDDGLYLYQVSLNIFKYQSYRVDTVFI